MQAQEHEFNTPLQLGDVEAIEGASSAEDADTYSITLQRQDIIVMASDGVLDNLWIDDMSQIVYTVLKVSFMAVRHVPCCGMQERIWSTADTMAPAAAGQYKCMPSISPICALEQTPVCLHAMYLMPCASCWPIECLKLAILYMEGQYQIRSYADRP